MSSEDVYMAKLAEQAERYEEMVTYMKKYAQGSDALGLEERNLLSVAYKNVVGARRASLRIILSIEQREAAKEGSDEKVNAIRAYKGKVEEELKNICNDILELLETRLIKAEGQEPESAVFYKKMQADYFRYLAEFASEDVKKEYADKAETAYKGATEAAKDLSPTHPILLGLALNHSVFLYEVRQRQTDACTLAKKAFDSAIAELDTLDEESYKDSTLIMQLLRDNLTLWTSDEGAD